MFGNTYHEEDGSKAAQAFETAVTKGDVGPLGPRILVADSDNDDSLGVPPPPSPPSCAAAVAALPPAFSKRATKCAAELLKRQQHASSAAQKRRCMQQLCRLGGAYRSLGQGQAPTVWVRYADLNAQVIRETEAYFDGRLHDRFASPHISRRNGSLSAPMKPAMQLGAQTTAGNVSSGDRSPIPRFVFSAPLVAPEETADAGSEGFTLSRGEQFALSLLSMEDGGDLAATTQPMPTYLLRKDASTLQQHVNIPSSAVMVKSGDAIAGGFSGHGTPLHNCWVYDETENGLSSVQTSPSAAHSSESSAAASPPCKRRRTVEVLAADKRVRSAASSTRAPTTAARRLPFDNDVIGRSGSCSRSSVDDDEVSTPSFSATASSIYIPRSLSATVIERQNHRVQWSLLRQQSMFSTL